EAPEIVPDTSGVAHAATNGYRSGSTGTIARLNATVDAPEIVPDTIFPTPFFQRLERLVVKPQTLAPVSWSTDSGYVNVPVTSFTIRSTLSLVKPRLALMSPAMLSQCLPRL